MFILKKVGPPPPQEQDLVTSLPVKLVGGPRSGCQDCFPDDSTRPSGAQASAKTPNSSRLDGR